MYFIRKIIAYSYNAISFSFHASSSFDRFFLLIMCLIGFVLVFGISTGIANMLSPQKTVKARIIDKKIIETSTTNNGVTHVSYEYYAKFITDSAEKFNMKVSHKAYRGLSIGDIGILIRKGTSFKGFHSLNDSGTQKVW